METNDRQHPPEGLLDDADNRAQGGNIWLTLCDDFVDLEGQCALLCELLTYLSRRETPLEPAGKHGIDMAVSQLRERTAVFKQQLYKMRENQ